MAINGLAAQSSSLATKSDLVTAGGLVLVKSQSFTTSGTVNVDSVFSSTYNNYKVITNITAVSTTMDVFMRMRVGGADNAASNYGKAGWFISLNAAYSALDTNPGITATSWLMCDDITSANTNISIGGDFYLPFSTCATYGTWNTAYIGSPSTTATWNGTLWHSTSTSFDGFSLYTSTGTITGTVRVYGYRNS